MKILSRKAEDELFEKRIDEEVARRLGLQYKEVDITIRVQVPSDCKYVAVDRSGRVGGFTKDPQYSNESYLWYNRDVRRYATVINWRDTLTEVERAPVERLYGVVVGGPDRDEQ